jgi:hypothetical protein
MIFAPGANAYPIMNYEYAIVNSMQPTPSQVLRQPLPIRRRQSHNKLQIQHTPPLGKHRAR